MRRDNCRITVGMWCQLVKGMPLKTRWSIRDSVSRTSNVLGWKYEIMVGSCQAVIKSKRRRCMTSGALEVREFRMNTTDSLSQWKRTTCLNQDKPHMWAATTKGKSSLYLIEEDWSADGHFPYNQCLPNTLPNPKDPGASLSPNLQINRRRQAQVNPKANSIPGSQVLKPPSEIFL